jgi:predicted transcriptional regulator
MRTKHTFRLPPDLAGKLADYATRKRVPQALVVETALASHLSPDGADRLEAALARRLDRMTRQIERPERHVTQRLQLSGKPVRADRFGAPRPWTKVCITAVQ